MAKTLAKNSLYTLISNIALAASNWLVLVLIAKSFETQQLGIFVLTLSLFSPAFLLASFKIRTLVIVDHDWEFKPEQYACARIFANCIAIALMVALAYLFYPSLPLSLLIIVAIYKFADAWSEFCQSYLRRHQHFEVISISTSVRAALTIVSLLLAIGFDASFMSIVMIWMMWAIIFSIVDSALFFKHWNEPALPRFSFWRVFSLESFQYATKIYTKHFTIAIALLIGALFVHMPNYALAHFFSPSEAGMFATISYFLIAGGILINSHSQAATPQLVHSFKNLERAYFIQTVKKLCGVGLLLGVLGIVIALVAGEWILTLFYNPQIATHANVLVWVMLAAGVRYLYIFLGTALAALQQFKVQTHIATLGFVVLATGMIVLVPGSAMVGAAQAMMLATMVECLAYLIVFRRQVNNAFTPPKVKVN